MTGIEAAEFFAPAALEDPYPLFARMRALGPVCTLHGAPAHFVAHHDAVVEAVSRPADFSSKLSGVLVCDASDRVRLFDIGASGTAGDVIATADEPEHTVQRRLLMPSMKAARIAALEGEVRIFARARIERLARAGGGDWCEALAEPLPAFVVALLLGLDPAETERVRTWAMLGGDLLAGRLDSARMELLLRETGAMTAFLGSHFDGVFALPGAARTTSVTSTLAEGVAEGAITREQAIGILVILFGAGGESTAALLGCALRLMLETPGLQRELRTAPERIPAFVEEAIRLQTPFKFHYRVVRHATTLCGTALRVGERLLLGWSSANRDERVFEDADRVRLDRAQPQRHLGFGHGIHFCIGAPIARLEVRIALEELLAITQHITLDPGHPPVHVPSALVRRLQHLRVYVE